MEELSPLRKQIDAIDDEILRLLNQRAEIALQVAAVKHTHNAPLHVPEREKAILERLTGNNPGPFPTAAVGTVFREVISACLNLEGPIRVAYLGPFATFTHQAALGYFGSSCHFQPRGSIRDVLAAVEKGDAAYCVVPVENSTEGSVTVTLDLVADTDLNVCGEVVNRIHHCLLTRSESLSDVTVIYSHPQPLAQCRGWLEQHMPGVRCVETASTARAAERAAGESTSAAIASALAGEVYGLKALAKNIEDTTTNRTRFWILSKERRPASANDKTSALVSIKDEAGSLVRMLAPFQNHNVNLTRIESRPSRQRPWEYLFFIDMSGHPKQPEVSAALKELKESSLWVKVLGAYPRAEEDGV
ncbi:MAG: prephenate dehydratase [Nitrospirota bacterium]|nr:prephenate dehydratase [Nitrospirota bacterium]